MKPWKVILAALVIFTAGLVTGAMLLSHTQPPPPVRPPDPPYAPRMVQRAFLERMKRDLKLSPEQVGHLESAFAESRERTQILWDTVGPEMRAELRDLHEKIRAELTPDQREKFEKLRREQRGRSGGGSPGDERRFRGHRGAAQTNRPPASSRPGDRPQVPEAEQRSSGPSE